MPTQRRTKLKKMMLSREMCRPGIMNKFAGHQVQVAVLSKYFRYILLNLEAGKISNVDLQRIVIRVFYYLCVVTLQYVAPMILVLYLALMYKTMGGGTWTGMMALLQ